MTLSLIAALLLPAQEVPPDVEAAHKALAEYLKGIKGAEAGRVTPLTFDGVRETFPGHVLFAVQFPQFPVARVAPEPLKSANVVAVPKKDGKPIPVTDAKELEKLFKDHARPVKDAAEARAAARAWLRATAELSQDGFYKFAVRETVEVGKGDPTTAAGEVTVDPAGGNKGGITATLTFKDGKLTAADTKVNLVPGPRPICQATKLLDPDPVVRRMAEDAIRVMGSACRPYLAEQRAAATPEVKAAIDAAWRRIVGEGR